MSDNYLFLKTFIPDIERVSILCDSVQRYNRDGTSFVIAVPNNEIGRFKSVLPSSVNIIAEEDIAYFTVNKRLPGWREQQLIKFMFGVSFPSNKYLILDSDCQFIKDFSEMDLFGGKDSTPLIATEGYYRYSSKNKFLLPIALGEISPIPFDKNKVEFFVDRLFQIDRRLIGDETHLRKKPTEVGGLINFSFGRADQTRLFFMPTPIVWSSKIVCDMWYSLREVDLNFSDLLLYSPWEAIWYGHWALSNFKNEINLVEPLSIHFSKDEDIVDAKNRGISKETLSKNFYAVTLASRHQNELVF
ncbi:hypothetical protein ABO04_09350 [Nitrosomonas sp. HPC101]|uniref:DUF6492 family protein n=1 Tax=Nitrosomonas sp. HPC101 TaxID=1658667 RepID=UPI00136D7109|nr:DUF6492 family protein [Nitrosomonas sp. HPC101]MXS86097.1 hypothetical protein [Nitrosomonas sp. HPC101]